MPRKKEIHKKPRFSFVSNRAYDVLTSHLIDRFPIDPMEIIAFYPCINIASYTELQRNTNVTDPFGFSAKNARIDKLNESIADPTKHIEHIEAVTKIVRGDSEYMIVYDDRVRNDQRIRWTIAHELGHIFLGHLVEFEMTALNRSGLSPEQYGILEVEAHWFAAELLAPRPVVSLFDFEKSPTGISLICDISPQAAAKRLKQFGSPAYGTYPSRRKLQRNFHRHIFGKDYLKSIFESSAAFSEAPFYPELCKFCRVCYSCKSFVDSEHYRHCPFCGKALVEADKYFPFYAVKSKYPDTLYKGINLPIYEEGKNKRLLYCPVCKNHDLSGKAQYCGICGTSLYNHCLAEDKHISVECRYCPDCGSEATYCDLYGKETSKASMPLGFEDYIEFDYWDYVRHMIGYQDKKDMGLYATLSDSTIYCDGGDFVLFTPYRNLIDEIRHNAEHIQWAIETRGLVSIERLRCYCEV